MTGLALVEGRSHLAGRIGELVTQFGAMLGEDAHIKRTLNRYARDKGMLKEKAEPSVVGVPNQREQEALNMSGCGQSLIGALTACIVWFTARASQNRSAGGGGPALGPRRCGRVRWRRCWTWWPWRAHR